MLHATQARDEAFEVDSLPGKTRPSTPPLNLKLSPPSSTQGLGSPSATRTLQALCPRLQAPSPSRQSSCSRSLRISSLSVLRPWNPQLAKMPFPTWLYPDYILITWYIGISGLNVYNGLWWSLPHLTTFDPLPFSLPSNVARAGKSPEQTLRCFFSLRTKLLQGTSQLDMFDYWRRYVANSIEFDVVLPLKSFNTSI